MYGLVNEAIRGMVLASFDEQTWVAIAEEAGVDDEFISMHSYDDADTYALVSVASEKLGVPADEILEGFGKHWIQFTAEEGYGSLVEMMGDSLEVFLRRLGDDMHARVVAAMPALQPPEFFVEERSATEFIIRYRSHRQGLSSMVKGLLEGLAEKYQRQAAVTMLSTEHTDDKAQATFLVEILDRH
ncbi:MAG: heme NO-binding domain-containing protein [Pseudomonadaceae bacterium]|nr:heme NO-binding domain-containing protein [Pseudomonadaceae bacterium]